MPPRPKPKNIFDDDSDESNDDEIIQPTKRQNTTFSFLSSLSNTKQQQQQQQPNQQQSSATISTQQQNTSMNDDIRNNDKTTPTTTTISDDPFAGLIFEDDDALETVGIDFVSPLTSITTPGVDNDQGGNAAPITDNKTTTNDNGDTSVITLEQILEGEAFRKNIELLLSIQATNDSGSTENVDITTTTTTSTTTTTNNNDTDIDAKTSQKKSTSPPTLPLSSSSSSSSSSSLSSSSSSLTTLTPTLQQLLDDAAKFDQNFLSSVKTQQSLDRSTQSLSGIDDKDTDEINFIVGQSIQVSKKKKLIEVDSHGEIKTVVHSTEQARIDHANNIIATVTLVHELLQYVQFPPHLHNIYTPHKAIVNMTNEELKTTRLQDNIIIKPSLGISPYADICKPVSSWEHCGFTNKMLKCLSSQHYTSPFPVQQHVLPLVMSGNDVLCCANTGSGKTLGFILPLIRYVLANKYDVEYSHQSYHWEQTTMKPTFDQNNYQILPEPIVFPDGSFDPIEGYRGNLYNKEQYLKWYKQRQKSCKSRIMLGSHYSEQHSKYLTLYRNHYNPYPTTITVNQSVSPHALILVPTRELALQIETEVHKFSSYLHADSMSLNVLACFGGRSIHQDIRQLRGFDNSNNDDNKNKKDENNNDQDVTKPCKTADILIATPGRLIELLGEDNGKVLNLLNVGYFVIDEADRMFDLGFEFQLDLILKALPPTVINKVRVDQSNDDTSPSSTMTDTISNSTNLNDTATSTTTTINNNTSLTNTTKSNHNNKNNNNNNNNTKPEYITTTTSRRQTLLFSATFPYTIERIARKIMKSPIEIQVNNNKVNASIIQAYMASYDDYPHRTFYSVQPPNDIQVRILTPPTTIEPVQNTPIPPPQPINKIPINTLHKNLYDLNPIPSLARQHEYKFSQLLTLLGYWASNQLDIWYYNYFTTLFMSYPGISITPQLKQANPFHVTNFKVTYTPPLDLLQQQYMNVVQNINAEDDSNNNNNNTTIAPLSSSSPTINGHQSTNKTTTMPTTTAPIDLSHNFMSILFNLPILKHRGKVIIFVDTKAQVDELVVALKQHSFQCLHVHGDQPQEDRDDYLDKFKTQGCASHWEKNFNQLNLPESLATLPPPPSTSSSSSSSSSSTTTSGSEPYQCVLRCPQPIRRTKQEIDQLYAEMVTAHTLAVSNSQRNNTPPPPQLAPLSTIFPYTFDQPDQCDILVTTSILSRGIDVPSLSLVVNYECPSHFEDHIHRVGRTGRGTNSGFAVTFMPYQTIPPHLVEILQDEKMLKERCVQMGKSPDQWDQLINPNNGERIIPKAEQFDIGLFQKTADVDENRYLKNQGSIFSIINHIVKENYKLEQISSGINISTKKKGRGGKNNKKFDVDNKRDNSKPDTNNISTNDPNAAEKSTTMNNDDDGDDNSQKINNKNTLANSPFPLDPQSQLELEQQHHAQRHLSFYNSDYSLLNALPLSIPTTTGYIHLPKTVQIIYCFARYQVYNNLVRYDQLSAYKSTSRGIDGKAISHSERKQQLDEMRSSGGGVVANSILHKRNYKRGRAGNDKTNNTTHNNRIGIDNLGDNNDQIDKTDEHTDISKMSYEERRLYELRQKALLLQQEEQKKQFISPNQSIPPPPPPLAASASSTIATASTSAGYSNSNPTASASVNTNNITASSSSSTATTIATPSDKPGQMVLVGSTGGGHQLVEAGAYTASRGFHNPTQSQQQHLADALLRLNEVNASAAAYPTAMLETVKYSASVKATSLMKMQLNDWGSRFNVMIERIGNASEQAINNGDRIVITAKPSVNSNCISPEEKKKDERYNVEQCKLAIKTHLDEKAAEEQRMKQASRLMR